MSRHYNRSTDTSTNVCLQTHIAGWVGGDDNPQVSQELLDIDEDLQQQLDPEEMVVHDVPVTRPVRLLVNDAEWLKYLKVHHPDQQSRSQALPEPSGPLQLRRSSRARRNLFAEDVLDLTRDEEEDEEEEEEDEDKDKDKDEEEDKEDSSSSSTEDEDNKSYLVDKILDEKPDNTKTFMLFLIKWKGYDDSANSWVSFDQLATCLDALNSYLLKKHAAAAAAARKSPARKHPHV